MEIPLGECVVFFWGGDVVLKHFSSGNINRKTIYKFSSGKNHAKSNGQCLVMICQLNGVCLLLMVEIFEDMGSSETVACKFGEVTVEENIGVCSCLCK